MAKKYTFDLIERVVVIREFTGENSDSMTQTNVDLFDLDLIKFDSVYTTKDGNIFFEKLNIIYNGILRFAMDVKDAIIVDVNGSSYVINDQTLPKLLNSIYTKQTIYKTLS